MTISISKDLDKAISEVMEISIKTKRHLGGNISGLVEKEDSVCAINACLWSDIHELFSICDLSYPRYNN